MIFNFNKNLFYPIPTIELYFGIGQGYRLYLGFLCFSIRFWKYKSAK